MELIINMKHDVLSYCDVGKVGTLKGKNLFGYRDFTIVEFEDRFEIDFWNDDNLYWTYKCKFTDHGNRLVITI